MMKNWYVIYSAILNEGSIDQALFGYLFIEDFKLCM